MVKTTKAQRQALKRVYDRPHSYRDQYAGNRRQSYRAFRKTVQGGPGCIMVAWCGLWLGIELDGYTHS